MVSASGRGRGQAPRPPARRQRLTRARRIRDREEDENARGIEMQKFFSSIVQLDNSAGCTFKLDEPIERRGLARKCWHASGDSEGSISRLSNQNVQFCALLQTLVNNTYRPVNAVSYEEQRMLRVEMMLCNL
eukprot:153523-Pleurochrysis_carterae.AAC.1